MKRIILKNYNAFSLAEVMIALVIVAILMAASAPLVNRRASLDNNFQCFWHSVDNGIYYGETGAQQVGIGIELPNEYGALFLNTKDNKPQITFYSNGTKTGNLGITNAITIGNVAGTVGDNSVVIGNIVDSIGENTFILGNSTSTPLLFGQFDETNLNSQILKVNGQLQVGFYNSGIITSDSPYSLYVDNGGIFSAGNITGGTIYGNSLNIKNGDTSTITLSNNGNITGTGLNISGNITGGTISGTELNVGTGNITGGTISGTYLSIDGDISGTNLKISETIDATDLGESLTQVINSMIASQASDEKLKNDITDTHLGLDIVRKIEVKQYKFKDPEKYGGGLRYGVIAQEIQKILPNVVNQNNEGFLTIRTNDIFFIAINAIKELDMELQSLKQLIENKNTDKLKTENSELKNEINLLKEQNQKLEKRLLKIEKQLKLD